MDRWSGRVRCVHTRRSRRTRARAILMTPAVLSAPHRKTATGEGSVLWCRGTDTMKSDRHIDTAEAIADGTFADFFLEEPCEVRRIIKPETVADLRYRHTRIA